MPLRIAMFSWESMHSIALGGLAPHATELAAALTRLGHEIHLFTRIGLDQSQYECIEGVHYHRCPFEHHPDFMTMISRMNDSFIWHFAETEAFLGRPFDIVHGHDWLSVQSIVQAKNRHGRPTVMTVHSTEFGRCGNSIWDDPTSHRIRDAEWEGTFVADRVICVSQALGKEVTDQYNVASDKISAIYNGVHARRYDQKVDVAAVRHSHGIAADDSMVLFAGRLTWQKGPDLLLEAIPGLLDDEPRSRVVFAGDGDMRTGLEARAIQMGLSNSTRFLGHQSGGTLLGLFKSADVVCVPSRNEPFGIVILEAWSACKPVVVTKIGGPAEFVRDYHNGLKVSLEPKDIGSALAEILSNAEVSQRMGRNGRMEAETRFSWDHAAENTEKVYNSVLNVRRSGDVHHGSKHRTWEDAQMSKDHDAGKSDNGAAAKADRSGDQVIQSNSKPTAHVLVGTSPAEEQIRARAYQIYLNRGMKSGDPAADWLQAEHEIRNALAKNTQVGAQPPIPNTEASSSTPAASADLPESPQPGLKSQSRASIKK